MSQIIQPELSISDWALAGINSGIFERDGGIVREISTGRIVEFLKDAISKGSENASDSMVETVKATADITIKEGKLLSLRNKYAVGTLVIVGVAAIGYGSYKLYTFLKERSDKIKALLKNCVEI